MSTGIHSVGSIAVNDVDSGNYEGINWIIYDPIGDDLSPDADGIFPSTHYILVDLSHLLSRKLGRQMPMTATYRVVGAQVALRQVDDVDDNDRSAFFGGTLFYHSPTKHKIDALQAARRLEKILESDEVDADSVFFSSQRDYEGFRFNWNEDEQVSRPTSENLASAAVIWNQDEWCMQNILAAYGVALEPAAQYDNALWIARNGFEDEWPWVAQISNAAHEDSTLGATSLIEKAERNDWVMPIQAGRHVDVLGGLMLFTVKDSNTIPNGDISPDDYKFQISIQVEGWNTW